MSEFKVGDKVKIYGGNENLNVVWKRTVTGIRQDGILILDNYCHAHPKQCRRLKPKRVPREFFVWEQLGCPSKLMVETIGFTAPMDLCGKILVREVLKKK